MASKKTQVLILGGGFGGVKAALELHGQPKIDVTLLSDQPNFRYYPALYRAAVGKSSVASSIPLKEIFKNKNIRIINDSAKKLDQNKKLVQGISGKKYNYDVLIIALGVVTNFFGIKGLREYSFGIKTLEDAQELRNHLHQQMMDEGQPEANYVVIGAGPTGVELAASMPAYLRHIMKRHNVPPTTFHVDLVEAAPRVIPRMSRHYSSAIQKRLRRLGVKLHLNQKVEAETADGLTMSDHNIKTHTVVWTAGVTNHPFFNGNGFGLTEHGKVKVNDMLQADEDIYVIGDNADTPYSGMAQTALYDGKFVAENLKRLAVGQRPRPYKPHRPVYVTPVGKRWAAVQWGGIEIYGWLGWLLRQAADLIGYHDLQPWWPAYRHWAAANQSEEDCPICSK